MVKIILSGYMGSGKSTAAQLLHRDTGLKVYDLDEVIEQKTQQSVAEIFASKGEIHFRKIEHQTLRELLQSDEDFILSLGGGTPCYAGNDELLKNSGASWVYLKASPATLFERLANDRGRRPLLDGKSAGEMREFIAKSLFDRSYYYNQAACKIDTDQKSPEEIAAELKLLLA